MSNVLHRLRFARDHRWAPEHLSAYLDSELAPRARARLERHAAECPECRGALGGLRRMIGLLHRLPPAGGAPDVQDLAAAVRARLHERRD
jgi:anti-sigma factor RsiW